MSFDARSRERLEALGRQLPKPLPLPEPARSQARSDAPRHAVELEQDPEQLFRELMAASADGNVPPHLLERLRELEVSRRLARAAGLTGRGAPAAGTSAAGTSGAGTSGAGTPGAASTTASRSADRAPGRQRTPRTGNSRPGNTSARNAEEESLYTAFQQLLLEDDNLAD
jgi:hypothetical protein